MKNKHFQSGALDGTESVAGQEVTHEHPVKFRINPEEVTLYLAHLPVIKAQANQLNLSKCAQSSPQPLGGPSHLLSFAKHTLNP